MITSKRAPFGMVMPEREFSEEKYRFGFNGQEKDDGISGSGNSMTAEFWQYDSRLGKRWNCDPIVKDWESPYATFGGNPTLFADPLGLDKEAKTPDGKTGNFGDNATISDDGKIVSYPNGITGVWDDDLQGYKTLDPSSVSGGSSSKNNPTYQEGTLWKTDKGQQAVFPKNQGNLPSGWTFQGSGIFNTSGRTNMVQMMRDYPGSYQFYMPRTQLASQMEDEFAKGGRDAVIGLGVGTAAPFVIAYGAIYGSTVLTIANERTIEYYFVTNIALNNARNRAVSYAITFLVRRFGAAALPAIQYLQKYGDKMDPMMLRSMLEAIVKKLAGSEATRGMTPTNYYMVPGTPNDVPVPNGNSK